MVSIPFNFVYFSDMKGHKSDWFNLFAELDPLQNPDSLGKKKDGDKKDGGAC